MEHKKDIGNLLKDRLDNMQKTPKQTLWERLDNSLNERQKKRRRAAWFWYGGAGILLALLLIGGILWTQDGKETVSNAPKITTEKSLPNTETKIEDGIKLGVKKEAEIKDNAISETITNNSETKSLNTEKKETTESDEATTKKPVIESGFKVTTTHQYYNSDLDTTTTSQNKSQIDSLVVANKRYMAIQDSIARKRAQDSIKLNEAKKDSIPN